MKQPYFRKTHRRMIETLTLRIPFDLPTPAAAGEDLTSGDVRQPTDRRIFLII